MSESSYRECPFCGEEIKTKAIKCKHCQSMLETGSKYSSIDHTPETQTLSKQNTSTALWRRILGFRSLTPWKMVVGGLFYLCSIIYFILMLCDPYTYVPYIGTPIKLRAGFELALRVTLPYLIVYLHLNLASAIIEKRLKITIWVSYILIVIMAAAILFANEYLGDYLFTRTDVLEELGTILFVFLIFGCVSFSAASVLFGIINKKPFVYIMKLVGIANMIAITVFIIMNIYLSPI